MLKKPKPISAKARTRSRSGAGGCGRGGFVIGRDSFEKISAVEGIFISEEMKSHFSDFDRKGTSSAERRRVLKDRYGKRAG